MVNFWNLIFWISVLCILVNIENLIKLLLITEISWICMYCYTITLSSNINDITLLSNSFFIIGFASLEICIGLLITVVIKNLNLSLNLYENNNNTNVNEFLNSKKTNYINRFF